MRLAHFSDVHLLELKEPPLTVVDHARRVLLTGGVPKRAAMRVEHFESALAMARAGGAEHLLITGDLTEEGTPGQYALFAEVLAASGFDRSQVTLVPGNHDGYFGAREWRIATRGVLRPWAETSREGATLRFGSTVIVPVWTLRDQPVTRSAGELSPRVWSMLDARARECEARGETLVVAQHHPPFRLPSTVVQWFDGLQEVERAQELLTRFPRMHVMHGHLHGGAEEAVARRGYTQIHGALATVGGGDRVRFYDIGFDGVKSG